MRRTKQPSVINSKFPVSLGPLTTTTITGTSITCSSLSDSGLSSGRVPYAGTVGLLSDTNNFRYDSTNDLMTVGWYSWKGGTLVTPDFSVTNSTTLTNITSLTASLKAGRYYRFRAVLFVDADVTGGHKYAMGGTATAISIIYQINSIANATNTNIINSRQTALGGSSGQSGSTASHTVIEGCILVNQAGTLTVQVAENTAVSSTSVTVKALSTFEVVDFSYS